MLPARWLLLAGGILAALLAPANVTSTSAGGQPATRLPVAASVDVTSRFGGQRVILTGWIEVAKGEARLESGVTVSDLSVESARLLGASQLGVIEVTERPDQGELYASRGETRALQAGQEFPASSFIDFFAQVSAPQSPIGPITLHNEAPIRLVPWQDGAEVAISAWPPLSSTYRMSPLLNVDNDGDGLIDEDTADEDGDVLVDEDRAGMDPITPGLPQECGADADCDGQDGEDPPASICGTLCDDDGDGAVDEDPGCLPLFNEGNTSLTLGVCLTDLSIGIAPGTPSFSVAAGGPSRNNHPADILGLAPTGDTEDMTAPYQRIACSALGLTADGCDDGSDGTQDDIDGLSYGLAIAEGDSFELEFSVGPGALGLAGTAVEVQHNCPPASPGIAPEPETDVFSTDGLGGNTLVFDGNGPVGACTAAFPLGLIEGASTRDDLDALDGHDAAVVDTDGDGVPERPVYFSLAAGSPSLAALGFSPGDILVTVNGLPPTLYASAAALGLGAGDDIDAFCLQNEGATIYSASDLVYYSLAPRLQGSVSGKAGPADILAPGEPALVVLHASELGLRGSDDLDALECHRVGAPHNATGDVTCDGETNAIDALFVLQYDAHLLAALPCATDGDVSGDGRINSLDASLILQYAAGLLGPVQ